VGVHVCACLLGMTRAATAQGGNDMFRQRQKQRFANITD
jgi:hypothetical protein